MKNILIDCDPGHDDVMAILSLIANRDKVNILGITTVCGNNYCELITENTLNVLSYIHHTEIPVARGQLRPLLYEPEPQSAHGYNGLEGFEFPKPHMSLTSTNAITFMHEKIMQYDKVTILALAPLTNIALLLKTYPEVHSHIEEIVLMGGSIYRGNILPRSEFNIYGDPHAAQIVMESNVPTTILPLEGCDTCLISEGDINYWKNKDGHVSRMVAGLLDFFAEYGRKRNQTEYTVFDLGVAMYVLHPEIFEGYSCTCNVVLDGKYTRGMTVIDKDENSHNKVLTKCNTEAFRNYFRKDIDLLDNE